MKEGEEKGEAAMERKESKAAMERKESEAEGGRGGGESVLPQGRSSQSQHQ